MGRDESDLHGPVVDLDTIQLLRGLCRIAGLREDDRGHTTALTIRAVSE